jgi:hypothetical protein
VRVRLADRVESFDQTLQRVSGISRSVPPLTPEARTVLIEFELAALEIKAQMDELLRYGFDRERDPRVVLEELKELERNAP